MDVRFLLGPAGSGKTFRCLAEVREALKSGQGAGSLLFIAPKQATFQLERQVFMDGSVGGFMRLEILSFERLAEHVLKRAGVPTAAVLGEEGRVMVLMALLGREEGGLKYFRRSARGTGLAREFSGVLRTFQEHGLGAGLLRELSDRGVLPESLRCKLADWGHLLAAYDGWLKGATLEDPSSLVWQAVAALGDGRADPWFDAVWMDGFAEMTPAEVALLAAVTRRSRRVTVAFCLDRASVASGRVGLWNVVERTFRACHAALGVHADSGVELVELEARSGGTSSASPQSSASPSTTGISDSRSLSLQSSSLRMATEPVRPPIRSNPGRFSGNRVLGELEERIATGVGSALASAPEERKSVRLLRCRDPHEEAEAAAGLVEEWVRGGGRYREAAVLVRSLDEYGPVFARVFRQRGIPSFLDHRHGLRHHPLVELTRTAMRVAADEGSEDDWFAWLKCGLLPLEGWEGEELENALRAGRWAGRRWLAGSELDASAPMGRAMRRVTEPLRRLTMAMASGADGPALEAGLRRLWSDLGVEARLIEWDDAGLDALRHQTVLHEMEAWLVEASRAFSGHVLTPAEWLPVVESAWSGLTAGALPPSLDQVLIGAVDRSRNPELSLVILPGWTEGGFPAAVPAPGLLTLTDREWLERTVGLGLGPTPVDRVHHEQFYAYIALTRSSNQVAVTVPMEGLTGGSLLPSPLLRRWLPEWELETVPAELVRRRGPGRDAAEKVGAVGTERLSSAMTQSLWAGHLQTSASALEQMAGCRFAHFAGRVLRLGEREELSADAREQGTWSHRLLAEFHRSLTQESLAWRDVTPDEGESRVRTLAELVRREEGLISGGAGVEFALRRAEGQVVAWVRHWLGVLGRWPGEPQWVEAGFGHKGDWPALVVRLEAGGEVRIEGQVDRVDLLVSADEGECAAWVVDYKRGERRMDERRVAQGFELQLPLYLKAVTEGTGFLPGGMTYATLVRSRPRSGHRGEPADVASYSHRGRVDVTTVQAVAGPMAWEELPFQVRIKRDGSPSAVGDGVLSDRLAEVLDSAVKRVGELGAGLMEGDVGAVPMADRGELPCEFCAYRGVCRIP